MTISPVSMVPAEAILNILPLPVLVVGPDGRIIDANSASETFFQVSRMMLCRNRLRDLVPATSPVVALVENAQQTGGSYNEYRIDIGTPRIGMDRIVDVFIAPTSDNREAVVVMLQEKTIAEKIDRQLTHRGAARSISALGSMLAHEIKNPLSGIRGAAQLLELNASEEDRELTQLICEETDRIVTLVDRFEDFADGRPVERQSVNIHAVLEHVKRIATSGFARNIRFTEAYDPSLPPVFGNRDQLVQILLNLVKNAAEAIGPDALDGEIEMTTAYRAGVRMAVPGAGPRVALPLEICIRDNGPGIPQDLTRHLFEPFFSTKPSGSGLGLAMVAKIVGDHGGVIESDSLPRRTTFRVLMPMYVAHDGRSSESER